MGDSPAYQSYHNFVDFLDTRVRTLKALSIIAKTVIDAPSTSKSKSSRNEVAHALQSAVCKKCAYCKSKHRIYACTALKNLTVKQRNSFVRKNALCYNCLAKSHMASACPSKSSCSVCKRHTYLHSDCYSRKSWAAGQSDVPVHTNEETVSNFQKNFSNTLSPRSANVSVNSSNAVINKCILRLLPLATARICIRRPNGRTCIVRALLDQRSECSFISENIAQYLGLPRQWVEVKMSGIGDALGELVKNAAAFKIMSDTATGSVIPVRALILRKITSSVKSCRGTPSGELSIARSCESRVFCLNKSRLTAKRRSI